jgi:hypothetical protein
MDQLDFPLSPGISPRALGQTQKKKAYAESLEPLPPNLRQSLEHIDAQDVQLKKRY